LLDPAALARVIPGCHGLERIGEHRYRAEVTLGVGFVKARYRAEIALAEIDAPRSLRLSGSGISALGAARGSGRVTLEARDGGTRLSYEYESEVSGKVAAIGARMLDGAAKVVLKQLFAQLGRESAGGSNGGLWQRILRWLGLAK
jgi:2-furoyl-CoA dehydrogenase large subunit